MACEFKKQDGNENGGNSKPCVIRPEVKRTVIIPRCQTELDRRRSARREQPKDQKKKPQ